MEEKKRVIALGFFDGVHVGHGALLSQTVSVARENGWRSCVLTFDVHPQAKITGYAPPLLNTASDRAELLRRLYGCEEVIFAHFDELFMHMSWREFIEDMLCKRFHAAHIVVGHDFHFGYKAEGNPTRLEEECARLGLGCDVLPKVELDGIVVSSTYIRGLVAQGDMERAARFLGHPHSLAGVVQSGEKLGGRIGFPTINLAIPAGIQSPGHGVYLTHAVFNDRSWPSLTNVGVRPTVSGEGSVTSETTILGFEGDLYGQAVRVEFLSFVRPEKKFGSLELLKEQIHKDMTLAKAYFGV